MPSTAAPCAPEYIVPPLANPVLAALPLDSILYPVGGLLCDEELWYIEQ